MAIQYLHKETDDSEMKPLLRSWCKEQVKNKIDPYGIPHIVTLLKQSKSKEWVVIETEFFSCLIHAESQLGQELIKLIYELRGDGVGIVIIPEKKGKLGFSVGLDDEVDVFYEYKKLMGVEEGYLDCSTFKHTSDDTPRMLDAKRILKTPLPEIVSVIEAQEDFLDSQRPELQTNGKAPRRGKKTP